jgi:hypothetical protein
MPHAEHPLRTFADDGKGLGKQLIQRFSVPVALTELVGFGFQLDITELLQPGFERVDFF